MVISGFIIIVCWILFIYNLTKNNPNDFSGAFFAVFLTGPIVSVILWSVGTLIEALYKD